MITENEAWHIAERFGTDVEQLVGKDLVAVFVIGSLSVGSYHAGRSDIDTLIVVKDPPNDYTRKAIKALASCYRDQYQVPKDFGAVLIAESELYPPYNPEQELVPEIIRVKSGVRIRGEYDVSKIPQPTKDDFLEYARVFYPWLRENYIDIRPEDARTIDATVNTLLYEMRLLIWNETSEYVLDKRKIVPLFCDIAKDPSINADMHLIHQYVAGNIEHDLELNLLERLLTNASKIVRNRVPL